MRQHALVQHMNSKILQIMNSTWDPHTIHLSQVYTSTDIIHSHSVAHIFGKLDHTINYDSRILGDIPALMEYQTISALTEALSNIKIDPSVALDVPFPYIFKSTFAASARGNKCCFIVAHPKGFCVE